MTSAPPTSPDALAEANGGRFGPVPTFGGRPLALAEAPGRGACVATVAARGWALTLARLADGTTVFRLHTQDDAFGFGAEVAEADLRLPFQALYQAIQKDAVGSQPYKLALRQIPVDGQPTFALFFGKYHRAARGCKPHKCKKFTSVAARVVLRPLGPEAMAPAIRRHIAWRIRAPAARRPRVELLGAVRLPPGREPADAEVIANVENEINAALRRGRR